MPDFPKTIYVAEGADINGEGLVFEAFSNLKDVHFYDSDLVAIYTLKEVKKKVTNVTLEEI